MPEPTDKDWVDHWRRIGPQLEALRRLELRRSSHEQQSAAIDALLQIACERATPRHSSGLIELQRLLAKAKQ